LLGLFRINDPYRLLFLFVLLLGARLPYVLLATSITVSEVNWMTIGAKLAEGGVMYKDVWEPIGPLAAGVYWLLHVLFGAARWPLQILALIIVCWQATLFNQIMYRNKAYNENSYVPAFIYGLLMLYFYDMATLSPVLMSMTFVLLALNNVYLRIENRLDDPIIFRTGMYLGIAALFHLPSALFLFSTILSFAFFTGTILRRYLLMLIGFLFPFLIASAYYYWYDALYYFQAHFIWAGLGHSGVDYIGSGTLWLMVIPPAILLLITILKVGSSPRFTNYQSRVQQVMLILLLFCIGVWLINHRQSTHQLAVFVPPMAFFISHWLLLFRKKVLAEAYTFLLLLGVFFMNYGVYFHFGPFKGRLNIEANKVRSSVYSEWTKGKKLLVLGDADALYHKAKLATPYLAWELAPVPFSQLDYFDHLTDIYQQFSNDPPEIIIDLEGIFPQLQQRVQFIQDNYVAVSKQVYLHKKE
jgi:hypothetical protein